MIYSSVKLDCWHKHNNNAHICILTQKYSFSKCLLRHDVVRVFVSFCVLIFFTRHFVMVPLNLTYLHCLQHSLFEHHFNLYYYLFYKEVTDTLDKEAIYRCMVQCYEMHQSEKPKLEDIVKNDAGYMKSAKSMVSLGGSLLQGVVVTFEKTNLF